LYRVRLKASVPLPESTAHWKWAESESNDETPRVPGTPEAIQIHRTKAMNSARTSTVPSAPWLKFLALLAVLFGLMTIKEGGSVLFVPAARQAAGNFVPFVLWFNFIAGFWYIIAGVGIWFRRRWAAQLSAIIATLTVVTFLAFGVHIFSGGLYEVRTIAAMTLRSVVWLVIAISQRSSSDPTDQVKEP
jgi:hypothetical protein